MLFLGLLATPLVLVLIFSWPAIANAGFLTKISSWFGRSTNIGTQLAQNSQTVSLLEAPLSPNTKANGIGGGDIIVVDDSALLAEDGPAGAAGEVVHNATTDQISVYVVREGDSLSQIAEMHGVNVNTIVWANDLKSSTDIHDGQVLVILPVSGVRHTVKSGDTLKSIATKYDGDLEEISQYNNISSSAKLVVGEIIIVPDGEIAVPASSGSSGGARGNTGPSLDGYYIRPINGGIKTQGIHGYNGVDIGASVGTPIYAAASGTVIISRGSGWNGGYGAYIVIKHNNGTQTLYAHNSQNVVASGQTVSQGDLIGYVGATGKATGAHLHFEVRGAKNPF